MKLFIGDEINIYTSEDNKKYMDIFIGNLNSDISYILWIMNTISLNKILIKNFEDINVW